MNRLADCVEEIVAWRHHLHANPELLYDVEQTADFVADKLQDFGCDDVVTGIGRTGVVGIISGKHTRSGKVIGLRADMDALPIEEATDVPYKSNKPGRMHACGHDGHTAMLLGAAKYLTNTRNFDGTAVLIFQPAEEGGAGGKAMVEDGLMTRFDVQQVYGLHNKPGLPVGQFAIRNGPTLAAIDELQIEIEGKGGHAAKPHHCIDPVLVGAHIVTALQSIVSRSLDPLDAAVISITQFEAGRAFNVIPQSSLLKGTVRSLRPDVRSHVEKRISDLVSSIAEAFGAEATLTYRAVYPATINHDSPTEFAASVAADVAGADKVDQAMPPEMGGEDFAFMLNERPGSFIFVGNGVSSEHHHPSYDFNDEAIPYGTSYWVRLVEMAMPAGVG